MESQSSHVWKFSRVGGVNRVNIESGQDLLHLHELDQKLWTVLSCPVQGLEIDEATLRLIDTDGDGRIRVPEVIAAVQWACSMLVNPSVLLQQSSTVQLADIQTNTEQGAHMLASAKQILQNLEKSQSQSISIDDTADTIAIFAKTKFNGDGIITIDSTDSQDCKKTIEACMNTVGAVTDRSGNPGVNQEIIEQFYTDCAAFSDWYAIAEANPDIFPFGNFTQAALELYTAIKSKLDDYFLRCRLAAFDPESVHVLHALTARLEAISPKDITTCIDEIATYPLSKIEAHKPLHITQGINPAWEEKMNAFHKEIVQVVFPKKQSISEDEWKTIQSKFDAYIAWQAQKAGASVESLGLEMVRSILAKNVKQELLDLVAQDKALETEANNIFLVDKLVRYSRDLYSLLKNFVTFYDFYAPESKAIFQTGRLYIDQRSCDLCISVSDMAKHAAMAGQSGMFLMYCDCVSKSRDKKMSIVVGVTNGDIDNIMVGRNAIFYDRNGNDWDATITKIVENPISIRQAFFSPYRKVARFIEAQANKFAASKDNQVTGEATAKIEKTTAAAESKDVTAVSQVPEQPKPAPQPFDIGKFVGIFAAIGMAIGAIGAVLASFISGFLGLTWWKMPLALLGIMLVISGPSMFIAWLKLRKRNLAPILDSNGWAINARVLINITFGNTLTHIVKLPKNAKVDLKDPFAAQTTPLWLKILYFFCVCGLVGTLLWYFGYFVKWGLL